MTAGYLLKQMSGPLGNADDRRGGNNDDPTSMASEGDGERVLGPLLDEQNPKKVVAAVVRNWKSQDEGMSRCLAEVEQAEAWRNAERWVYLRRTDNDRQYEVWRPPGIDRLPSLPDKVDELCRRLTAQLVVDAPELEAEPMTGEQQDENAAEMASRILSVEGGESGWNFRMLAEAGIDMATTQKCAYAHVLMHPTGRGQQCVTVMAAPAAQQYDAINPVACTIDPASGQPVTDLITKYLDADGTTLTDQETATTLRRWVPWPMVRVTGVRNGRFLPEWSRGLHDADGFIIADYLPIGMLKQMYPDTVGTMSNEELLKLNKWNPFPDAQLLPRHGRKPEKVGTWLTKDDVPDDAVALVLWEYHRQSPTYPKGARICVGGNELVLAQDTLEVEVERPDGTKVPEVLEMPVSQCRCLNDWTYGLPQGQAIVTKMGPWNEMMAQQWVAVTEWLDRSNNPFMFLPIGSAVQEDQVAVRDGRPIRVNPQGQPVMETVPPIATDVKEWYDRAIQGLNNSSLLSETANATELPNVNSGIQADTIINQVQVAMSSMHDNSRDFLVRLGRILLQQVRAYVTVPQTVKYVGDDAAYKASEWRGADLYGAKDVRLVAGSFTMMRPDQKRQLIFQDVQNQVLTIDDAAELLQAGTSERVGLEDDPVRLRASRQIEAFYARGALFIHLPVDDVPTIAHKRFRMFAKEMMSTRFSRLDPQRQQAFTQEYEAARQAAGAYTTAEQGQQAQQQAEQAAQQAATLETTKAQAKTKGDLAIKEKDHLFELQKIELEAALKPEANVPTALGLEEQAIAEAGGPPVPAVAPEPMPSAPPVPPTVVNVHTNTPAGVKKHAIQMPDGRVIQATTETMPGVKKHAIQMPDGRVIQATTETMPTGQE